MIIANSRAPDLYITGDGRHVAIRKDRGELAMLRTRSADFIRDMIQENAGVEGDSQALQDWPNADCNADACRGQRKMAAGKLSAALAQGRPEPVVAGRRHDH